MSLKDYKSDDIDLPEDPGSIPSSGYQQEINTLKIEKLSNRVTIISVIIPVLITAILAFAYMDMKERVIDVDETKKHQMDQVAKQLEEKVNALDVRIAKNRFDFDQKVPELTQKGQALENQVAKMGSEKAGDKEFKKFMQETVTAVKDQKALLDKLEKRIQNNSDQNKSALETVERINTALQKTIKENDTHFQTAAGKIQEEIKLFKEEFDARLLELADYDQEIAKLKKTASLLETQIKELDSQKISAKDAQTRMAALKASLEQLIKDRTPPQAAAAQSKPSTATPSETATPSTGTAQGKPAANRSTPAQTVRQPPQTIEPALSIDTDPSAKGISEETLTQ